MELLLAMAGSPLAVCAVFVFVGVGIFYIYASLPNSDDTPQQRQSPHWFPRLASGLWWLIATTFRGIQGCFILGLWFIFAIFAFWTGPLGWMVFWATVFLTLAIKGLRRR
jgi:hypothetical protein